MFPRPETRIKTLFRRSIDAAIDFATLGEYGLASAWEDPADGIPAVAGSGTATRARRLGDLSAPRGGVPVPAAGSTATATLLKPASAAGRARRNEERRDSAPCAGQHLRSRAMEPQLPRKTRSRDGMAPREQRCRLDAG
jgi:hypothetical protein